MGARWGCRRSWRYDRDISDDVKTVHIYEIKNRERNKKELQSPKDSKEFKRKKMLALPQKSKTPSHGVIQLNYQIICASLLLNLTLHWKKEARAVSYQI